MTGALKVDIDLRAGALLQTMLTMITPESVHTGRIAAFCDAFADTLDAPPSRHTRASHVEALAAAQRFLDWTLPPDPAAPVTDATRASVTQLCAAIAAHAWAISEEIAARPRIEPMKPVPSAADALLYPRAEGETDHAD